MVSTSWLGQCVDSDKLLNRDHGDTIGFCSITDNVVPQQRHQDYLKIRDATRAYDWTKGSREEFRREYFKASLAWSH
jgi:hypothetical protein